MMRDWEGYRQGLLGRIGELERLTPETVRGYCELNDAGNKRTALGNDTPLATTAATAVTAHAPEVDQRT